MTLFVRRSIIILLIISILFLPGCWDREELNTLAIITAIGIDILPNNDVEISVQEIIPQSNIENGGNGTGGKKTLVQSGVGKTIFDAKQDLQEKLGRSLFWGHAEVIIFGKRLAEKGIQEEIDFLSRFPEIRMRAKLYVIDDPKKVLEASPITENYSVRPLDASTRLGTQAMIDLNRTIQMLVGKSGAFFLPWLKISETSQIPYIEGGAVFKQDRLIEQISGREFRALLWINDKLEAAVLSVPLQNKEVGVKIYGSKTKLKPQIKNGKWRMLVEIKGEDDIYLNETGIGKDPEFTKVAGKAVEKEIQKQLIQTVSKLQKKNVDAFGFADAFHQTYPHEWHRVDWKDIFPRLEVVIKPQIKLRRTGMTDEPVGIPTERKKKVK